MIDLRNVAVGDEFLVDTDLSSPAVMTMALITEIRYVLTTEEGGILTLNSQGETMRPATIKSISKHEPRHWLKDFPDADLFLGSWLACDKSGEWYGFSGAPSIDGQDIIFSAHGASYSHRGIKMPTLTGDEWKLSKISIKDLLEWQKAHKDEL